MLEDEELRITLAALAAEDELLAREEEQLEQDKLAQKADEDRLAAQKVIEDRVAAQKVIEDRVAAQKADEDRVAAQKADEDRANAQVSFVSTEKVDSRGIGKYH